MIRTKIPEYDAGWRYQYCTTYESTGFALLTIFIILRVVLATVDITKNEIDNVMNSFDRSA